MASFPNASTYAVNIEQNRQPLTSDDIAAGALRSVYFTLPRLWPCLLASVVVSAANLYLRQTYAFLAAGSHALTPAAIVYDLALSILVALLSAVAIRILLGRGAGAWRLDRALAIYVALILASDIAMRALELLYPQKALLQGHADKYWGDLGLAITMMVLLWRTYMRLVLWPIGALMGAPVTPDGSSRSMKGRVWPYLAATFLLAAPPILAGVLIKITLAPHLPLLALGLGALSWGSAGIAMNAVASEVYRRLVGECVEDTLST
jgi:hypothetical protein